MIKQFIKFAIVGVINTGIHYLIFIILFKLFGVYYIAATIIGYCAGVLNSFILNKNWTFPKSNRNGKSVFLIFVLVNIASLLVNTVSMKFFVDYMQIRPEIGQIYAICFSLAVNFLGNKFLTFREKPHIENGNNTISPE